MYEEGGDADWPASASGASVSIPLFHCSAPILANWWYAAHCAPATSQFAPLPAASILTPNPPWHANSFILLIIPSSTLNWCSLNQSLLHGLPTKSSTRENQRLCAGNAQNYSMDFFPYFPFIKCLKEDHKYIQSVAQSIWVEPTQCQRNDFSVEEGISNRACSSYGHPPNARPHPSFGVSLQSHYFILSKREISWFEYFENIVQDWAGLKN